MEARDVVGKLGAMKLRAVFELVRERIDETLASNPALVEAKSQQPDKAVVARGSLAYQSGARLPGWTFGIGAYGGTVPSHCFPIDGRQPSIAPLTGLGQSTVLK